MSEIRDFLTADDTPVADLDRSQLEGLVEGYRAITGLIPNEVLEWLFRLSQPFRIITRKYEPKTGVLTHVKFEPLEFSLAVLEPSFDPIRGVRTIEQKLLTMESDAVLYFEDVEWSRDYAEWQDEQNLAEQSLDV